MRVFESRSHFLLVLGAALTMSCAADAVVELPFDETVTVGGCALRAGTLLQGKEREITALCPEGATSPLGAPSSRRLFNGEMIGLEKGDCMILVDGVYCLEDAVHPAMRKTYDLRDGALLLRAPK